MAERGNDGGREEDDAARAIVELRLELSARTEQDTDQTAAELDQTHADTDQTAADLDQLASDADQVLADRDQHASDRDQAASDWVQAQTPIDTAAGRAYEASRAERDAASRERGSTATGRSDGTAQRAVTASRRDEVARGRDDTAAARDRNAEARDNAADARDRTVRQAWAVTAREPHDAVVDTRLRPGARARTVSVFGSSSRQQAALERGAAAADREAAAADREQAAVDRRRADLDGLTGVLQRGSGELALAEAITRWRGSGRPLVLALLDVDALRAVNDREGHAAGDGVLRDAVTAIVSTMRANDVTVRWSGDEFVCMLTDVTIEAASERITGIQRAFATMRPGSSISAGLAELSQRSERDDLEHLIARADAALRLAKANRNESS
jgi:diguanylate cyclase (GGDEF)-like protein